MKNLSLILFSCLFSYVSCIVNVAPTWMASNYLQAASYKIINYVLTGNTSTPTATMPFTTSFSSIPNLGYGVYGYQGDDSLTTQMYQVNQTSLTTSSFSVLVKIQGTTNIWLLQVRYVGISKSFPHHLNSFDNVPVNYTYGPLINITSGSSSVQTFTNTINYTAQTTLDGLTYRNFSIPLTNNKILLFMTSMYVSSNLNTQIDLKVTATPISNESYQFHVTNLGFSITRLHFSMIVFDEADVQRSGLYMLVYQKLQWPTTGGFYSFPSALVTNFMLGLTDYTAPWYKGCIHFNMAFTTISGSYGISMPTSVPRDSSRPPLTRFGLTVFYLKTWICPSQTWFDINTGNCSGCPILNCINCQNLTVCQLCDQANLYYLNTSTGLCQQCSITGCITCNRLQCIDCNQANNYVLQSSTCVLCNASANYFANIGTQTCVLCSLSNCLTCTSLTHCSVCATNYYVNPSFQCSYCNNTLNYFMNGANCQLCSPTNCLNCSSLTQCSICNQAANYFVNTTDHLCYLCTVPNCMLCQTNTTCQTCNTGYFVDSGNCVVCSLTGCLTCNTLSSICSDCTSPYGLDTGTGQCHACTLTGCLSCITTTTCENCNIAAGYVLKSDGSCELCTGTNIFPNVSVGTTVGQCTLCSLNQCTTCTSLTVCSVCNSANSYFLQSNVCAYCDPTQNLFINPGTLGCQTCTPTNCLTCLSFTQCTTCNQAAGYFINTADKLCYPCAVSNCQHCQTLNTCQQCDDGYQLDPVSFQCFICSLPGCLTCTTSTTCSSCNVASGYVLKPNSQCQLCISSNNYFPNTATQSCQPCTLSQCTTCTSLTNCQICATNNSYYRLGDGTCGYCNPAVNLFIDPSNINNCQLCTPTNCLTCSSFSECSVCDQTNMYLLNNTDNLCYLCTLANCLECQNFTVCRVCDQANQYFLNSTTGTCSRCVLEGCINCTQLDVCYQCDIANDYGHDYTSLNMSLCGTCNVSCICDGYTTPWNPVQQECTPICGDGLLRINQQCDDNNSVSGDGCSSSCKQQSYYNCTGQPSNCTQMLYIQAQLISIQKQGCNGFKIVTKTPNFKLQQISENIFIMNQGIKIVKTIQNQTFIEIHAQYYRDIINEKIILHFSPGEMFNIAYEPTIPALYYDHSECAASDQVEKMLQAAEIISYAILIISILSCKIVGLELFGVLQLSYFTLSSHSFLNVYLSPLTKFRTFNGLNVGISPESSELPKTYQQMGVAGSFINNCNVMLFVLFGQLVAAVLFYIVTRILRHQKLEKVALRFLKQGFITLVLFNIFNISFSAGVHWKYASSSDPNYLLSSVILFGTIAAMILSVTAMELTGKQDYGQYKNKFKKVWICQLYIPLTVVYRMALGFYSAIQSDYDESTLIILGFSLAFLLYTVVNLPFTNVYQNYRCSLIHLTMLATLFTTNYYRSMKSNTPLDVKGRIYAPALMELILMITCIGVSFIVLIYEVYQMIKEWRNKKRTQNSKQDNRHITEESFAQIN